MRLRRKRILSVLRPGEVAPTMTCFPLMGVGDFVSPPELTADHTVPSRHASSSGMHVRGPVANSAYVPDDIINPHPRFGALTKNIRVREGGDIFFTPLWEPKACYAAWGAESGGSRTYWMCHTLWLHCTGLRHASLLWMYALFPPNVIGSERPQRGHPHTAVPRRKHAGVRRQGGLSSSSSRRFSPRMPRQSRPRPRVGLHEAGERERNENGGRALCPV